ncbi:MAG: hypothetical protein JWQ11_4081, partial [Rhizobacter sp.]|nr:hypothetical protein [Rhizobacter sp.]
ERELSLDVDFSSFGGLTDTPADDGTAETVAVATPRDFDYPETIDPNDPKSFGSRAHLLDADDIAALDFQLEFSLPTEPDKSKDPPKTD